MSALYADPFATQWYRLLDPPADHRDEAASYEAALERAHGFRPETLLELGAGAGHNASHLSKRFRCTLTDISEPMQALSRELNPTCEHLHGDMRTMRLGRVFDAVLVHDAIMYMCTEDDLRAVADTSFVHLRPGGVAVFAPDVVKERFEETTNLLACDDVANGRALRGIEWSWDPDPNDDTIWVEYCLVLRDGDDVRSLHDRTKEGLFSTAAWRRILESAGFSVESTERRDEDDVDEVFLCRRPT